MTGIVGPTGSSYFPQPATATPTYAAPTTPTLNLGTGVAKTINIGNTGSAINLTSTVNYGVLPANAANDAAAATAGVPVGGTYRNGSALQVRVA